MFPFFSQYGELVAYQARLFDCQPDKLNPKYFNTVFTKTDHLFGLWQNREKILAHNYCVVVEGPMDVLSLAEINIPAVALLGVNMSQRQAFILRQFTDRLDIWLDSDDAGKRGVRNLQELLRKFRFTWFNELSELPEDANSMLCKNKDKLEKLFWT